MDTIVALFALLADTEGTAAGEELLDEQRAVFERAGSLWVWRAHKLQCLVVRGENQAALKLVDDETEPRRRRQVRQALFAAIARKEGNPESLGTELESEFLETGDGDALFLCCLSRRTAENWPFIADHAERLVGLVGTDAALRVGAEGALNARRAELALKLLREHVALCPGGVLPPDLERLRAEAFKQQGLIHSAVEAAEKAASVSPDLSTLAHLFLLQRSKGDLIGSAKTAGRILKIPNVPPQFLTEEVAPTIRRVAPELAGELVLKAKQSLPEDSPTLLLVAQQASKLGLSQIAHEVLERIPLWVQKGVEGIEAVDVPRMTEMLRQQAESQKETVQQHRRGFAPVHALSVAFNVVLARLFLETSRFNIEDGYPMGCLALLTRHAALAGQQPVPLESSQELFLDVTSLLLLSGLNLLEVVETAFPKIAVPARLTSWLQAEADELQPGQPEVVAAQEQALRLADAGKLKGWSNSPDFPAATEGWPARMGPVWCERLARVKANGGVLVDLVPLMAKQPELEPVVLPEAEAHYVFGQGDIVASLEACGRISPAEADAARKRLGLDAPNGGQRPRSVQLHSGLEVHLEPGVVEGLTLVGVLKPLSEAARVFVHEFQIHQWRGIVKRHQSDAALLPELERLLAHISQRFEADHYRGHECAEPCVPPAHYGPLSGKELCVQDTLDYAANGPGIWCVDGRFLRGLRREPPRPCADTFDLVQHLYRIGRLTQEQLYDVTSNLRAANLRYLPVGEGEILHHVRRAPVEGGALVETVALRRLRRYMATVLLDAEWLQRPVEAPQGQRLPLEFELPARWYLTLAHVIAEIWKDEKSTPQQRAARSNWVWEELHFDMGLVQELFGAPVGRMSPSEAAGQSLGHLFGQGIVIPGGTRGSLRSLYFEWLFNHCVAPLAPTNPEILRVIASFLRRFVDDTSRELDEAERTKGRASQEFVGRLILMAQFLFDLPPAILDALGLSAAELSHLGLGRTDGPFEVLGVSVGPSEFWPAVARALARGYAAILKPGTRLQMRYDEACGRVGIVRKGEGARKGGYLSVPCLGLVASERERRMAALQSCTSWFDLDETERQKLLGRLADIADPTERMRQLYDHLGRSASWFYRQLEERAKDRQARSQPFQVTDLMPVWIGSLHRHMRLKSESGSETETSWPAAVAALLEEEGLEETLVRLSCLPARLPESVLGMVGALAKTELTSLLGRLRARLQSPLQQLHLLALVLRFGDDLPRRIGEAKNELGRLLDPEKGTGAADGLLAFVKWSCLWLGWSPEARAWSAESRLRVAWVHAGRLHSAFAAGGFPLEDLAEWISENSKPDLHAQNIHYELLKDSPS